MQSVQRKFGRLLGRNPGDNAKVSVLLNDYEDADLNSQLEIANVYASLYDPIVGASDGHGRQTAITPELQLHRTFALKGVYSDLRTELTEDITSIESRIIQPANNARQSIAPIRKTIKKREDKRLDVEKTQEKVHKLHRKAPRTPKDDAQLAKAEDDLASLTEEFEIADHHLRETLPPIIQATFSLVPPLLAAHIVIQNRLLGLYYTVLHGYCEENDFPSPAPPMDEVIAVWADSFEAGKRDVESISIIARGRGIREPLNLSNDGAPLGRQLSAPTPEPGMRRASTGLIPSANGGRPRIASSNSAARTPSPQPSPNIGPRPDVKNANYGGLLKPTDFTTASDLGRSSGQVSPSQLRQNSAGDYFAGRNPPSPASTIASNFSQTSIAAKKKPPPPPPKRIGSSKPEEYVIAQYDFTGQGAGDLSFREGDRIKIVKKTQTDQDWWTGELAGVKGTFPANYCKPA
ncbi:SH3 domain-containing protein [Diaporthe helianthi]|uniref:SH3 domain-containing protein n=1 Tax=Diaporthe helianthi TaxID=158607 RepID=A0A2P5IFX9_DIAHE|nr:SH3 domain-containing protein [Diaporthe helianthi]